MTDMRLSPEDTRRHPPPADTSISQAHALAYWSGVPSTVDGMLGGFPQISKVDLQGSNNFVAKLHRRSQLKSEGPAAGENANRLQRPRPFARAVDCGAGIGRISAGVLTRVADLVDIVEPVTKFTDEITRGEGFAKLRAEGRIGEVFNVGLQDWMPSRKYDLIWNQWVLSQLADEQLIAYLRRCALALADGGFIIVKENVRSDVTGDDIFDDVDSSVTRSDDKFRHCFQQAGLNIALTEVQRGFPKSLFPVRVYGLQPSG